MRALACLSAAIAIAAGAFAAHGAGAEAAEWLRTGAHYQLIHAVAVLMLGTQRMPARLLLTGSVLFAATLYSMALGAPRWLGAITPVGGVVMIGGWLWAGVSFARQRG